MIRIFNVYVPSAFFVLGIVDVILLFFSISLGFITSYASIDTVLSLSDESFVQRASFVAVAVLCLFTMGLYHRQFILDAKEVALRIVVSFVFCVFILSILFYFIPGTRIWVSAFLPGIAIGAWAVFVARLLFRRVADLDAFKRRVLVLGAGPQAKRVENIERKFRPARFALVGFVQTDLCAVCVDEKRVFKTVNDLAALCERFNVEEIVLALEERRGNLPMDTLLACRLRGIRVTNLATFCERELGQVELEGLYPSWLIFSDGGMRGRVERAAKRLFDIVVSLSLLLFTLPVTLLTMLAILIEDGRPIFYRQERVGQHGKSFFALKFRSMRVDAEKDGIPRWASVNDSRVTTVGSIIRKIRVDEIPQIYNVLRGEMSFVGPRPERPSIVADLTREIPFYQYRHVLKPGITGWAQINYPYGASIRDAQEKLKFDLYYVKNYSIFIDLLILLQTIRVILWPQGAR